MRREQHHQQYELEREIDRKVEEDEERRFQKGQTILCEGKRWRFDSYQGDGVHLWLIRLNNDGSVFRGQYWINYLKRISDCVLEETGG